MEDMWVILKSRVNTTDSLVQVPLVCGLLPESDICLEKRPGTELVGVSGVELGKNSRFLK